MCACRSLPPIVAVLNIIAMIRQFMDPYVQKYQAITDNIDAWWGVRKERYLHSLLGLLVNDFNVLLLHGTARRWVTKVHATLCRYREFIGEETKRKWQWQRRNEEEAKFWAGIVQGIVGQYCPFACRLRALHVPTCTG